MTNAQRRRELIIGKVSDVIAKGLTSTSLLLTRLKETSGLEVSLTQDTLNRKAVIEFISTHPGVQGPVRVVEFSTRNSSQVTDGFTRAFRVADEIKEDS